MQSVSKTLVIFEHEISMVIYTGCSIIQIRTDLTMQATAGLKSNFVKQAVRFDVFVRDKNNKWRVAGIPDWAPVGDVTRILQRDLCYL